MPTEIRQQIAVFFWNQNAKRFQVEVCGYIVAMLPKLKDVIAFSAMHNGRMTEAIYGAA